MSHAIEELNQYQTQQRMMHIAELQDYIVTKYSVLIQDEDMQYRFRRDLLYLVQMIYREAQEPMVKQMTDLMAVYNSPLIIDRKT